MRTTVLETVQFGDLVVAAFDEAAQYSTNPRDVSRLATGAVRHVLLHARKTPHSLRRLRRLLSEEAREDSSAA